MDFFRRKLLKINEIVFTSEVFIEENFQDKNKRNFGRHFREIE